MKFYVIPFLALMLITVLAPVQAQTHSEATQKGAILLSGSVGFSSQGRENRDDRLTTVYIDPSLLPSGSPGFGLGGDLSLAYVGMGSSSSTSIGIGPKAAYFFDSGSNTLPFLGGGVSLLSYSNGSSSSGFRIKLGGGMVIRKGHLGLIIEADYVLDNVEDVSYNTLMLTVGFAGLLY